MERIWPLQDAKNKFSEVVERALQQGPQVVTRRGEKAVVVMAYREYDRLRKSQGKLSEFFRDSHLSGIEFERDQSLPRGQDSL